jgi:hypothetical protein
MEPLRWITVLLLISCGIEVQSNTYKIFSGYHFEKRPDIIPYESVIPMILITQIAKKPESMRFKMNTTSCINENNKNLICEFQENLSIMQDLLSTQVHLNFEDEYLPMNFNSTRSRRGLIILQKLLSWCCNVASVDQVSNIYENQKDLQTHTNEIIDSVNSQYKDLISTTTHLNNFTHHMNNLTDKMHYGLQLMRDEFNSISGTTMNNLRKQMLALIQQTWTYILYNYLQDTNQEILGKCHLNILSEKIIKPIDLSTRLTNVSINASKKGLRLAVPKDRLDLYYKLKIASCKIFNGTLVVKLNIPLINIETEGEVFKVIPTPVIWKDLLCHMNLDKFYTFKTHVYTKVISATEATCSQASYPLCLLPRVMAINDHQQCLHHILASESIEKLQKYCHYTCYSRPSFPVITQLLPNKYLITNIENEMRLSCDNEENSRTISQITAGTLELSVPCDCELSINDLNLIAKTKPCDTKDFSQVQSVVLLPATWSKLRTIKLFTLESGVHHEFNNLSEILDANWTINTPTFQLTDRKKIEHVTLKNGDFDIFNDTKLLMYIMFGWIFILTIIILIMIYCLHIQNIKMKFMVPARDYKTSQDRAQQ